MTNLSAGLPDFDPRAHTILVVDDNPVNLGVLSNYLEEYGFTVLVSEDGESGLQKAAYAHPDLILLDILLPGIDGFEVCRRLKADPATQAIPVIFITALTNIADKVTGFEVGAVDYVTKPFQAAEILARLATHLRLGDLARGLQAQNVQLQGLLAQLQTQNQQLFDLAASLQVANRSLETFGYSVSHDLRAPLRRIDGYSAAIEDDYAGQLDAVGRDHLRRIRESARRMDELIEALLRLARLTGGELHRQTVDLSAGARTVADELTRLDEARQVEFVIEPGLTAYADPRLLRVVLENLLGNAWKFTGRVSRARIELGAVTAAGQPDVYFVRDNGTGFDMAYADRLFGAFQRLHAETEFPGHGIGLATVQRIIHRHGGRVWAEAEVNKGATFYFTLEVDRAPGNPG